MFKILIAEDDLELRQLFRHVLLKNGYTVKGVSDGQEALDALTPEMFLPQLQQEKQEGWVCYLHYTKDVPDATVSVHHKTGQVEHLFVTESARGRGIGQKMLDFARKKLPEHEHPVLTVLNTNTRALALYCRMGWQVVGAKEKFDPAKDPLVVRPSQVLEMRYQG